MVKGVYCIGIGCVLTASIAAAQSPALPPVSVPGYLCRTDGSISSFTATCTRNPAQQVLRGNARPLPSGAYAGMMMQALRFTMYGGDDPNGIKANMICNANTLINLVRTCGSAANNAMLQAQDVCVKERHPGSCGMANIGDCCNPLSG